MADPTSRPEAHMTPSPPMSPGPAQAYPGDGGETSETPYRPLSMLALLGFGIASLYCVVMLILTIAALILSKPSLAPWWTLIIPVVAIFLCLAARIHIIRSEETLAGLNLTKWGMIMCIIVGLSYGAYVAAIRVALQQQADTFAQQWLEMVREGQSDRAFLFTLHPAQRVGIDEEDPNLRKEMELRMLSQSKGMPPHMIFQQFSTNEMVRMIQADPSGTKVTFKGMNAWDNVQDGYKVALTYQISTDECTFDAILLVKGCEAENGEFRGRQWYVDIRESGVSREPNTFTTTPLGDAHARLSQSGESFLGSWQRKLVERQHLDAFLDTRPLQDRDRERAQLQKLTWPGAAAGVGSELLQPNLGSLEKEYLAFLKGEFVQSSKDRFEGAPERRDTTLARIRASIVNPSQMVETNVEKTRPTVVKVGDRVRVTYGVRSIVRPKDLLHGILVVETDAKHLQGPADQPIYWQIVKCEYQGVYDVPPSLAAPGPQ